MMTLKILVALSALFALIWAQGESGLRRSNRKAARRAAGQLLIHSDAADAADDLYLTREYQMELLSRRADVMVSDNELESDNEMESDDEEESVDVSPRSNRRDPSRGVSRGEGGGAGDGLCLSALSVCANCL